MAYTYPAAAVGDRYLVTFKGRLCDQTILNTFYYSLVSFTGSPTKEAAMDDLRSAISAGAALEARFLDLCPTNYDLQECWIQPVWILRYAKKVYTVNTDGDWPADAQSANLAAVITRRGVTANRKGIGSLHVPVSGDVSVMENGSLTATFKTAATLLAEEVAKQYTGASGMVFNPIIPYGDASLDLTIIQSAFVQSTARVMRRRTVGLGI